MGDALRDSAYQTISDPSFPVRFSYTQTKRGQRGKQTSSGRLPATLPTLIMKEVRSFAYRREPGGGGCAGRKIQARPCSLPYSHALEWQGIGDRGSGRSNEISLLRLGLLLFPSQRSEVGHASWLQGCLSGTPGAVHQHTRAGRRAPSMGFGKPLTEARPSDR